MLAFANCVGATVRFPSFVLQVSRFNSTNPGDWLGLCRDGFGTLEAQLLCKEFIPDSVYVFFTYFRTLKPVHFECGIAKVAQFKEFSSPQFKKSVNSSPVKFEEKPSDKTFSNYAGVIVILLIS